MMSDEELSMLLRFVWGRARLPMESSFDTKFKLALLSPASLGDSSSRHVDALLPTAHTCFFELILPAYSSRQILRERLLFAIKHCVAIDTDFLATQADAFS